MTEAGHRETFENGKRKRTEGSKVMKRVVTYTYAYSVAYLTDNMLRSMRQVVNAIGLNPNKFLSLWTTYSQGIEMWLADGDMRSMTLEVYNPVANILIKRWIMDVRYSDFDGDGSFFWADTDRITRAIENTGICPIDAEYTIHVGTRPGARVLNDWCSVQERSADHVVRQGLGQNIELGTNLSYLRPTV